MTGFAAACQLNSCFQQGFSHPTPVRFLAGLAVIAVVIMAFRRLAGKGKRLRSRNSRATATTRRQA